MVPVLQCLELCKPQVLAEEASLRSESPLLKEDGSLQPVERSQKVPWLSERSPTQPWGPEIVCFHS